MEYIKKLKDYPIELESIVLFVILLMSSISYLHLSSIKQIFTAYSMCCMWFIFRKLAAASPIKVWIITLLVGIIPAVLVSLMVVVGG